MVNRGNESRPKDGIGGRDLNAVHGYDTALKVAQVVHSWNSFSSSRYSHLISGQPRRYHQEE